MSSAEETIVTRPRLQVYWQDIERMIATLLAKLPRDYDNILVITRGGMVPACMISERTDIRNIICATVVFYQGQSPSLPAPLFVQFPSDDQVSGRRILVVDDVWDTGATIVAVRDRLRHAGAIVDCCVLRYKATHSKFPATVRTSSRRRSATGSHTHGMHRGRFR